MNTRAAGAPGPGAPAGAASAAEPLAAGRKLGGRFEIEQPGEPGLLGPSYRAIDQKTQRRVLLHILPPGLFDAPATLEQLRTEIKTASALSHKNIAATFGMGVEPGGLKFVATELVDGVSLRALMDRRKAAGKAFGLRAAYNILSHLSGALEHAHGKTNHGLLGPRAIVINKAGRLKLGEFGLGRALLLAGRIGSATPSADRAYLAPEQKKTPPSADARTDIYSLGAILWELLAKTLDGVGANERLSQRRPDLPSGLDAIVARCLKTNPLERWPTVMELKAALAPLAAAVDLVAGDDAEDSMQIEVDVGLPPPTAPPAAPGARAPAARGSGPRPVVLPPSAHAARGSGRPPPPPARGPGARPAVPGVPGGRRPSGVEPGARHGPPAPKAGDRISINEQFRPIYPSALFNAAEPSSPSLSLPPSTSQVDLGALLATITQNDAERWMLQKDRLDHGPFSARELVQQILRGEAVGDHSVLNMDTGARRKLSAWAEFRDFAEQYRIKKQAEDAKKALLRAEKVEKRSAVAKWVFVAAAMGVVLVGGGVVFFVQRGDGGSGAQNPEELEGLLKSGRLRINLSGSILPQTRGGGGGGARAHSGAGGLSYEDAMNQGVNLGDVTRGGSEVQLSVSQIQGVMMQNANRFYGCIAREMARNPRLQTVRVNFAIAGSGQVLGASVPGGSAELQSCMAGRIRGVTFPRFGAPRMGASFSFNVGQ